MSVSLDMFWNVLGQPTCTQAPLSLARACLGFVLNTVLLRPFPMVLLEQPHTVGSTGVFHGKR
jgi:hypothetical protein